MREDDRLRVDSSNRCPDDSSICVRYYGDDGRDDVESRFWLICCVLRIESRGKSPGRSSSADVCAVSVCSDWTLPQLRVL